MIIERLRNPSKGLGTLPNPSEAFERVNSFFVCENISDFRLFFGEGTFEKNQHVTYCCTVRMGTLRKASKGFQSLRK